MLRFGNWLGIGMPVTYGGGAILATVLSDGWRVVVTFIGAKDGGTSTLDPYGTPRLVFATSDPGFDTSRNVVTRTRTIVGTVNARQAYLNNTLPVDTETATYATRTYVLAEPIYQGTTVTSVTAVTGLYTDNGTGGSGAASVAFTSAVSNGSTLAYYPPVPNWACSAYLRGGTDGFAFEVYADHRYAMNFSPVACVGVEVTDGAAVTSTGYATAMTASAQVSTTYPWPGVFAVSVPTTGLTDGAGTAKLKVWPWIGSAVWDSTTNGATWPTPVVATIPVLIDRAGNYSDIYAALDTVSGDNATGVVSGTKATAEANPFLTVAGARAALKTANNARGHNDNAGGYILLKEDIAGFGESLSANWTVGLTWGGFDTWTATSPQTIGITNTASSTNRRIANRMEFRNLYIRNTSNTWVLDGVTDGAVSGLPVCYVRLKNCLLAASATSNSTPIIYQTGMIDHIGTTFGTVGTREFRAFGTHRNHHRLHLGIVSTTRSPASNVWVWTAIGSTYSGVAPSDFSAASAPNLQSLDGLIHATCRFMAYTSPSVYSGDQEFTRGICLSQSVYEQVTAGQPVLQVSADNALTPCANIIRRHMTVVGGRTNLMYNDTGSAAIVKTGVDQANLDWQWNCKRDAVVVADGARVGNWMFSHGVDCWGGHVVAGESSGATTCSSVSWLGEHRGRNATLTGAITFTSNKSATTGGGDGTGDGNYLPPGEQANLLGKVPVGRAAYAKDIRGRARKNDGTGSCGAYEINSDMSDGYDLILVHGDSNSVGMTVTYRGDGAYGSYARQAWMPSTKTGCYAIIGMDGILDIPAKTPGALTTTIGPLWGNSNPPSGSQDHIGPGEFLVSKWKDILPSNRNAVVLVTGRGGAAIMGPDGVTPTGTISVGGTYHESAISQANAALALLRGTHPTSRLAMIVWCGPSNDSLAAGNRTEPTMTSAITNIINDMRTRITDATETPFAFLSILPSMGSADANVVRNSSVASCSAAGNATTIYPPDKSGDFLHPTPDLGLAPAATDIVAWVQTRPQPRKVQNFSIAGKSDVAVSTNTDSDPFWSPLPGTGYTGQMTVSGGSLSKNGGPFLSTPQSSTMADSWVARGQSSASEGTPVTVTVTCTGPDGDYKQAAFTITTVQPAGSTNLRTRSTRGAGLMLTNGRLLATSGTFRKETP